MMVQATVPSGLGLLFTPWHFTAPLILAAAVTMAAIVYLLVTMPARKLTPGSPDRRRGFYAIFAAGLFITA